MVDTGIGIRFEDQDKLFKLFGFVQDGMQLNTKGIGLGLVIAENIVTEFGGSISFTSEYGKGSTFTFSFTLETPKIDPSNSAHNASSVVSISHRSAMLRQG